MDIDMVSTVKVSEGHHQYFPKPKFNIEGLTGTSYGKDFTMLLLLTMQKLC